MVAGNVLASCDLVILLMGVVVAERLPGKRKVGD